MFRWEMVKAVIIEEIYTYFIIYKSIASEMEELLSDRVDTTVRTSLQM